MSKTKNTQKLTKAFLRKIISEERSKLHETLEMGLKHPKDVAKKTKEIDADKFADSLENCCNWYQMCKLQESKLEKQLEIVKETKRRLKRKILKNI